LEIGSSSCEEAVKHYLTSIESNAHLNCFVNVYAKESVVRSRTLDLSRKYGYPMGKMHGVIVGIKDVICYKDHPVTASSKILQGFTSIYNATAVERLLRDEAIIIGHLNCDEFAMGSTNENSYYGNVLNGLDHTRVPGGSSGGSAVAVQTGQCMVSLGSDTGGSVRQPADFCGIIGLKPTYGLVSRYGLIAYASSFDQIGIFAREVADVSLVLDSISGYDPMDSTSTKSSHRNVLKPKKPEADEKFRIAIFKEALRHEGLDPEIKETISDFLRRLRENGHHVQDIDCEYLDFIVPTYYILTTAEASSNLARFDGVKYGRRSPEKDVKLSSFYKANRSQGFGKEVKRRILLGTFVLSAGYYDAYFTKAQQVRKSFVDRIDMIFNEFDIIILPTAPTTAFTIGEIDDQFRCIS
jgi:aspartyl-tRNA(Asn)/glutamyl-tRNA(Gln) amidotransferase subunit A